MSGPEEEAKSGWLDRHLERAAADLRSPISALSFIIAVVVAVPIFYGWLYPPDPARLLIHYDPFTVYDPGKPVGIKIRIGSPLVPELQSLQPTILPDPPVKIVSPDGKQITSPVYDVEVSIWNGGSEPINRDRIRRPLVLTFPHVESFLGIRILHQNSNDGLKIVVNPSAPASLEISWDYMDPGRGFKFAVVFATPDGLYPLESNSYIIASVIDTDNSIPGMSWRNTITTIGLFVLFGLFIIAALGRVKRYRFSMSFGLPAFAVIAAYFLASFLINSPAPPF